MYKKLFVVSLVVLAASIGVSRYFIGAQQKGSLSACDALIAQGKYEEAKGLLAPLAAAKPGDPAVGVRLATVLDRLGNGADALLEALKVLSHDPKNVRALFISAQILRKQGKNDEAVAQYEALLQSEPGNAGALAGMGWIRIAKGDLDGAAGDFDKALAANAELADALGGKAVVLQKQGKTAEASKIFQNALAKAPDSVPVLISYGRLLDLTGRPAEARGLFEKALKTDPQSVDGNVGMAAALRKLGKTDDARPFVEKALAVEPGNVAALAEMGQICIEKGAYDDALKYFQQLTDKDKNDLAGYIGRGAVFFKQGDIEKGLEEFKGGLAIQPKSVELYYALGRAYIDRNMFYEGIQELQKIFEFSPKERLIHYTIGLGFLKGGFGDVAIEEFKAELALDPAHAPSHFNLGLAYAKSGNSDDAVKEYNRALEIDPALFDARYNLALLDAKNNRVDQAIKGFEKIVEASPNDVSSLYNLGILYAKSSQQDKAADTFKRVIAIDDKNVDARDNLAMILEGKGQFDDAIAQYQAILAMPNLESADVTNNNLGALFMKKGDLAGARGAFQAAAGINPKNVQAYVNLGLVSEFNSSGERYGAGFDAQACAQWYEKALAIDPNNAQAAENLRAVTQKSGGAVRTVQAQAPLVDDNATMVKESIIAGEMYYNQGNLEQARAEWNKGLAIDPANEEIRKKLAMIDELQQRDMQQVSQEKDAARAAADQEKNEAQKRIDIAMLLESGQAAANEGNYAKALDEWQKALALDPASDVAKANIQRAQEMLAQPAPAEAGLDKEKALKDQEIGKHLSTARIYLEEGYVNEAVQTWQKVLELDPENAEAKKGIADAQAKSGSPAAAAPAPAPSPAPAAVEAQQAAELSPLQKKLNAARIEDAMSTADVLVRVGDFEGAVKEYENVLAIDPGNQLAKQRIKETREGKGIAQEKKEQMDDVKRFEQDKAAAAREKGKIIAEYLTTGEVKFNQGQFEAAVAAWNNIIAVDPTHQIARKKIAEAKELQIAQENRKKRETEAKEFAKRKALLRIQEAQVKRKKEGPAVAQKAGGKKKIHVAKKRDAFLDEKYLEETLGSITGDDEDGLPEE